MSITIYHNPKCGTSRNVLAMIRASGEEPDVIEYLKAGWTRPQIEKLFAAAGLTARQAMRTKGSPAEELGLTDPAVADDAVLDAMVEHPILVNRPFVQTPKGARLCRPSEVVLEILPAKPKGETFKKEDGQVVFIDGRRK